MSYRVFAFILVVVCAIACSPQDKGKQQKADKLSEISPEQLKTVEKLNEQAQWLHQWHDALTDAMMTDAFTPPVGARIYVYPNIAYYEIMRLTNEKEFASYSWQVKELEPIPQAKNPISHQLAALYTYYMLGTKLVYTTMPLDKLAEKQFSMFKEKLGNELYDNSIAYAEKVIIHFNDWMQADNYQKLKTPQYSHWAPKNAKEHPEVWQKTPPRYFDAIEPNWNLIRPMVIDSGAQFDVRNPTAFSSEKGSQFYEECMVVYNSVNELTEEQENIAKFWDCNPNILVTKGHTSYFLKKLSPGGHWMAISGIASRKEKNNALETAEAYSLTAIAIYDGFIACWNTKFRTNLIRPETYINRYIDKEWLPILETPPFPEYTSGHSVVSSAASEVLTKLFGDNFAYQDSTELDFGLTLRSYKSFKQAASEAAISRLYGGIHYLQACNVGLEQGTRVAQFVLKNVSTRNNLKS